MVIGSPKVSVIVPCRNEKDEIEITLRSILAQESPPGGFEVIVSDGQSDDGTRDVLKRLAEMDARLRIVDNPKRIVSTGLNAAIYASQGEVIVRMDAHTNYAPDYIRRCVEVLDATASDNVGGPWIAAGRRLIGRAIAGGFQSAFAMGGARGHNSSYEGIVDTVYLGCWPRRVFDRFGLFDEELVRNQDDEFNLRLTRGGAKIWQSPVIRSVYKPRESLRSLFQQYLQYGYWKVRVIQKHARPASFRHLLPAGFILVLLFLSALSLRWSPARWALLALTGLYFSGIIGASGLTALRHGWQIFFLLPLVFICYHFGYGIGFLHGILDFIILKRGPSSVYTRVTRSAHPSHQKATV
jgi:succinoglycan biosynthesis protein ExoA